MGGVLFIIENFHFLGVFGYQNINSTCSVGNISVFFTVQLIHNIIMNQG